MGKRLTIEEVRDLTMRKGFELVTDKYINNMTKLIFKDKNGYFYESTLTTFSRAKNMHKFHILNPFTIQNIKLLLKLNNMSLELISKKYKKHNSKLIFKDENGYLYGLSLTYLQEKRIPKFNKSNPYTIQNIKLWCKLNDKPFELISNKYESNKNKLYWKCLNNDCEEMFDSTWNDISHNRGCPYCCNPAQRVGLSNCLATKNPELALEWHPILNGKLTPYNVTSGSNKKVWWVCKECGNEWEAHIANRNNGTGCPECNESHGEKRCRVYFNFNNILYILQKTFDGLIGLGGKLLSYDFYLPKYNLLIEYQGGQHEKFTKGIHQTKKDFERQQEHDKRKREYAKKNNINLLEIWYWDFDKVEKILDSIIQELSENDNSFLVL